MKKPTLNKTVERIISDMNYTMGIKENKGLFSIESITNTFSDYEIKVLDVVYKYEDIRHIVLRVERKYPIIENEDEKHTEEELTAALLISELFKFSMHTVERNNELRFPTGERHLILSLHEIFVMEDSAVAFIKVNQE